MKLFRSTLILGALTLTACSLNLQELLPNQQTSQDIEVTIVHESNAPNLDATSYNAPARTRLMNLYDGLVRTDSDLKIVPGLATSWGNIDELTWEFKIRQRVVFHNGTSLTIEDVIFSLERAKTLTNSEVAGLLSNIDTIQKVDDQTIHIITAEPDPVLLSKLEAIYIVSKEYVERVGNEFAARNPIGSGPYFLESAETNVLTLKRFEQYWGPRPDVSRATIRTIANKNTRTTELEADRVDILTAVPTSDLTRIESLEHITVIERPSLSINFLAFNVTDDETENPVASKLVREAISRAIDKDAIVELAPDLVHPINQLVSSNIFGYNPELDASIFDPDETRTLLREAGFDSGFRLTLDLEKSLEKLGQELQAQLFNLRIRVDLNLIDAETLTKKILNQDSRFFLIGWQFETGDSGEFLSQVLHSRTADNKFGKFNGMGYRNTTVDRAIEQGIVTVDSKKRLALFQSAFRRANDDYVTVPLFEQDNVYALSERVEWVPRQDGLVRIEDIRGKE